MANSFGFSLHLDENHRIKDTQYTKQEERKHILYAIFLQSPDLYLEYMADDFCEFVVPVGKRKLYFGITMCGFETRMKAHRSRMNDDKCRHSKKLYNALRYYGFDSFTKVILEDNMTGEEANNSEIYYISKYDTYKNGLNSTRGGDSFTSGDTNPVASAVKIYNNTTGEITYFSWQGAAADYLKVRPNRISLVVNPKFTNQAQLYSKHLKAYFQIRYITDNTPFEENMLTPLEKVSLSKSNSIIVVDLDTREEQYFNSTKDASKHFNIEEYNIVNVLNCRKCRQFNVDKNRYDVQKLPKTRDWDFDILPTSKSISLALSKKVYYINTIGQEVIFNSRKEAAQATRGKYSLQYQSGSITKSIQSNGTTKCPMGFIWFKK